MIKRDFYLSQLLNSRGNHMIKVVTGVRRCGKSYLLFNLFKDHLLSEGVDESHIIEVDLENRRNKDLRDPDALLRHIDGLMVDKSMYYILLDEVQMVSEFEDVLNSYLSVENADVYVTGSNARFLSKDVITEFRGRGHEIRIHPLGFSEFLQTKSSRVSHDDLLREYMTFGGLPQVVLEPDESMKEAYLQQVMEHTYLRDIKQRNGISDDHDLEELVNTIASSIGGLTNPLRIQNTFVSEKGSKISANTVKKYLDCLEDAFLIERSVRYDIKGRRYIDTPYKYYFEDLGLRNARLGFRQTEFTHLMENLLYNEMRRLGWTVDVGQIVVERKNAENKRVRSALEVDFVCNKGYRRVYVQSAYRISDGDKMQQETLSLRKIQDGFQRVVIVGDALQPTYMNNDGLLIVSLWDFLQNPTIFYDN